MPVWSLFCFFRNSNYSCRVPLGFIRVYWDFQITLSKHNPMTWYFPLSHLQSIPDFILKVPYLKECAPVTKKGKSSSLPYPNAHIHFLLLLFSFVLYLVKGSYPITLPNGALSST